MDALEDGELNFHFKEKSALNRALNRIKGIFERRDAANEESSQNKLFRVMTHEIMNTVAPIASLSDALLTEEGVDVKAGLETISASSKDLIRFVESYRSMTQAQPPVRKAVMVDELMDRVLLLNKAKVAEQGATLTYQANTPDLLIYADEGQIMQVFNNLIKNAVQAGATSIRINADLNSEDQTVIRVANNGKAIPLRQTEEIFIPFYTMGILMAKALEPLVNRLLGDDVGVKIMLSPFYLVSYLLIVIVVALLAGIIPATVVSRAKPIDVVTGAFRLRNKMVLSKVFIVLQNVIAIVLIALVITMEVQMRHMEQRPVGCRTENLFYVNSILSGDEAFENDLMALPCVKRMGHSYGYPGGAFMGTKWMPLDDRENKENWVSVKYLLCDTTAFDMFGFDIKAMYGQLDENQWLLTQGLLEAQTGMPLEQFDIDSLGVWYKRNLRSDMSGVLGDFALDDAAHVVDET